ESNLPKNSTPGDDGFRALASGPEVTIMPQKIMDVLMLGRCSHEFSWPRRGADGDYYQVCLLCAAEYKYDWTTMRRTQRVEHAKPETVARRSHTREKRPSWTPRARRLKLDVALRYRVNNTSAWHEGTIDNLSQSGLLFRGPQQLPVNALIEMVFEMPEEISGQKNRNVLCQGRVMRSKNKQGKETQDEDTEVGTGLLAASIVDYKFIH
ncbi:MAG: PilZ domain-containing protein, partial [Candidatus Sulfotelmatobacter sp.]